MNPEILKALLGNIHSIQDVRRVIEIARVIKPFIGTLIKGTSPVEVFLKEDLDEVIDVADEILAVIEKHPKVADFIFSQLKKS